MVRAWTFGVSLMLAGCSYIPGAFLGGYIDPETGCCVYIESSKYFWTPQYEPCTCACEEGDCTRDQVYSLDRFPAPRSPDDFLCTAGYTIDLACETPQQ